MIATVFDIRTTQVVRKLQEHLTLTIKVKDHWINGHFNRMKIISPGQKQIEPILENPS